MNKVFLVDDDVFVRKGIMTLINWEQYGFKVCGEADNGEDALDQIKIEKPNLVITDIRMPVLDGLELIHQVNNQLKDSPYFIIISGYNDFEYAQKALRYGVKDFILKPIDQVEIQNTLKQVSRTITNKENEQKNINKMLAVTIIKRIIGGNQEEIKALSTNSPLTLAKNYRIIMIEVNGFKSDSYNNFQKIQEQLDYYNVSEQIALFEDTPGYFVLCITSTFLFNNNITFDQFTSKLLEALKENVSNFITFYIGQESDHFQKIRESYLSAKKLIQYKYVLEHEDIICHQIASDISVYFTDLDHQYYTTFYEIIEENNADEIKRRVEDILQICINIKLTKNAVRTVVNRLIHDVLKNIKEANGCEKEIPHLEEMLVWDRSPITIEQLKPILTKFFINCSNTIVELYRDNVNGTICQVKKYILDHYDENLTIKKIANRFYLNPVYMGQLFKKTYNMYVKDFILKVRMEEAKKLLRQTDYRVYEIAKKVGYNNPDYFVAQFEKMNSNTPTQYKKYWQKKINKED